MRTIVLGFSLAWCLTNSIVLADNSGQGSDNDALAFDYIVVGGGASGLVVANRLTENRGTSVLVLERGGFDDKIEAIVPWYGNLLDTSVLLNPQSAPVAKLNNATWSVAVANVVGGGTVVSGMGGLRGSKADYDAWEELGNPGWGWNGLLKYFRKSTTFTPPTAAAAREFNITWDASVYGNGPARLHIPSFQYPDIKAVWDAFRHQGVPVPPGGNNGNPPAAVWLPSFIDARTQTRSTARNAYYDPVNATRHNLRLLTGQTVTEILFARGKPLAANGVRAVSALDNTARSFYARKEVILAAGAIQTPQLLQVSGIGPADVLRAAGIPVKKDVPGVGANLQDTPLTLMIFDLANQTFPNSNAILSNATYNATSWEEYLRFKTGPITSVGSNSVISFALQHLYSAAAAAAVVRRLLAQNALLYLPDVYARSAPLLRGFKAQRTILANRLNGTAAAVVTHPMQASGFTPAPLQRPLSRGTVTLNTTNPHGLPVVQFNALMNPTDSENIVSIVRRVRRLWASPELAHLLPTEAAPGAQFQTDEEILGALTANLQFLWPSLAAMSGTAAMMPESLGGVVGPDLRVYGVDGLSIVDASIMPLIIAGALQGTVYAIAEKAADLIKARGGGGGHGH
ncbi:hypothetical protein B0H63DRAFT_64937 [Podospora didyma]|uniref:Glucose-methanol-choline oxidoreductase N-terminal domain-containing protein n=1 Tax=Podospora didyma TaxID=330526 RepID=A0AAE0P896_9PEZI|nr:hypothetical protein B0H63DRAFT_64937 [Podospora didyma]